MIEIAEASVDVLFLPHLGDREEGVLERRNAAHVGQRESDERALRGFGDDWHVAYHRAPRDVAVS